MDREAIQSLISELRRRHGELEGVEAKAAHTGTPADLFKPLSAFANRAGRSQRPGSPDGAAPAPQLLCGGD
ncbi:MAG: hypothetical protein ACYDHX_12895 [Methanothrix sp.]